MNRLNKLLILITVFSLLSGQTLFVLAQDETKENKTSPKKTLKEEVWVGKGYDATEKYADSTSVKDFIFEVVADDNGNPVLVKGEKSIPVQSLPINKSDYLSVSAKSISEFQTKFSNKLSIEGEYKLFSGHLKASFGLDEEGSTAKDYVTIMQLVILRSYRLPARVTGMVREDIQQSIDNDDPIEVFQAYGTHYIKESQVGGRVDYSFTQNRNTSQKEMNIEIDAKAAIKAVIGSVSVQNETSFKNFLKKIDENGTYKISSVGGAFDVNAKLRDNPAGATMAEWINTVNGNPSLSGFGAQGLVGIWELASKPERKQQLKEAFEVYLESKAITDSVGKIDVKRTNNMQRVGENWYARNSNRGAIHQIGVFSPIADPENGYYVVGHVANNNSNPGIPADIDSILVKEFGEPGKLLAKPLSFTQVYNDKGTGGLNRTRDWSIWRANCPVNFVALGYFAKYEHSAPNTNIPSENPFKDVRCVNISLVEEAPVPTKDDLILDGEPIGGQNLLVYLIKPDDESDVIDGNFFYPDIPNDFKNPPPANLKLYVLKNPKAKAEENKQ